jgi:hypothetical protein
VLPGQEQLWLLEAARRVFLTVFLKLIPEEPTLPSEILVQRPMMLTNVTSEILNRDSSVGKTTGYGLDDREVGV